jgi:hypothetical protein
MVISRIFVTIKQFIYDEPELCGVFGVGIPAIITLMIVGWV